METKAHVIKWCFSIAKGNILDRHVSCQRNIDYLVVPIERRDISQLNLGCPLNLDAKLRNINERAIVV